jgi:predicted ATP-dependent protease
VVIGRKVSWGGQIYIDKAYFNAPMCRDEKQSGHYVKRIINFALQQENINPDKYDIFVLSAAGRENFGQEQKIGFGRSGGKSAGSALYLALLSALAQKPLSCQVAATGALSLSTK